MRHIILDCSFKKTNLILNYKKVEENIKMLKRNITTPICIQLLLLLFKTAFSGTTIRVDNGFVTAANDWNKKKYTTNKRDQLEFTPINYSA